MRCSISVILLIKITLDLKTESSEVMIITAEGYKMQLNYPDNCSLLDRRTKNKVKSNCKARLNCMATVVFIRGSL